MLLYKSRLGVTLLMKDFKVFFSYNINGARRPAGILDCALGCKKVGDLFLISWPDSIACAKWTYEVFTWTRRYILLYPAKRERKIILQIIY